MTSLREDLELVSYGPTEDGFEVIGHQAAYDRLRAFLDDFERVAELGEKATPGPWNDRGDRLHIVAPYANIAVMCDGGQTHESIGYNMALIVVARNFIGKWGKPHD